MQRYIPTPLIGDYPFVHDGAHDAKNSIVEEELRRKAGLRGNPALKIWRTGLLEHKNPCPGVPEFCLGPTPNVRPLYQVDRSLSDLGRCRLVSDPAARHQVRMSEAAFSPGAPERFWDYGVEVRRSFRRVVESLTQADRLRTKQESLAEMRRFYDGHQVNFAAQIVIGTGMRG